MNEPFPGRYRHYKGNEYEVLGVARHSETMEEIVVYRALYGEFGLWVRPRAMFLETVEVEGKVVPRFERVGGAPTKIKLSVVEEAFEFVSFSPPGMNGAYLDKSSGEVFYTSDEGDFEELPDDIDENDKYIDIPHKNDLDLGKELVFRFIADRLPSRLGQVHQMFTKKGAYTRFKDFLDRDGTLQEWYDFQEIEQRRALKAWCEENGIELVEEQDAAPEPI